LSPTPLPTAAPTTTPSPYPSTQPRARPTCSPTTTPSSIFRPPSIPPTPSPSLGRETTSPTMTPTVPTLTRQPTRTTTSTGLPPAPTVPSLTPSLVPSFLPSFGQMVTVVEVVQTVAGVTRDSPAFREAFVAALRNILSAGSTVTIVSVTITNSRVRVRLLAAGVQVLYTVSSVATSESLVLVLKSPTSAVLLTTALQTTYPEASVAAPTVRVVATPPTAAPVELNQPDAVSASASGGMPSIVPVIGGAVGGLLLVGGLLFFWLRYRWRKSAAVNLTSAVDEASSPTTRLAGADFSARTSGRGVPQSTDSWAAGGRAVRAADGAPGERY
jgi:hypothetical protein